MHQLGPNFKGIITTIMIKKMIKMMTAKMIIITLETPLEVEGVEEQVTEIFGVLG